MSKREAADPGLATFAPRLRRAMSSILDAIEDDAAGEVSLRERIAAIVAIARIWVLMEKAAAGERDSDAGSTARKYAAAFTTGTATNATHKRARGARSTAPPAPERPFSFDDAYPEPDELALDS